jgi:DNA (cytosine-5)-methyltransferase 1
MEKTLGSLFDGIGGFPLAASRHGIKTLWASEIEPFPIIVTKTRLPEIKHLGDITKIDGTSIEPVDVVTFGSPCQDLSVAGKRAGLAGERSGLFMEAIRIIKEMRNIYERTSEPIRPRFAVWENVPGAFSSNKGEDFRAVLEETARVADETVVIPRPPKGKWSTVGTIMGNGYSIAWRILDAQYWGVPQRRRRIFLVADFGGQSAPEILFKREGLSRHIAESGETRKRTTADAERSVGKAICNEIAGTLDSCYYKGCGMRQGVEREIVATPKTMLIRCGKEGGGKGALIQDDKSATLSTLNIQTLFQPVAIENHPADSRVKLDESGTVQTLTTRMGTGGGNVPMLAVPTYCIQGNCIDRADTAGCNGKGRTEDVCYTLNTIDRPAVMAIEPGALSRGQGERVWDKCPTLRAKMGDNQPCVVLNDQGGSQMDVPENVTGTLRAEMHGNIPAVTTYSFQRSDAFKETDKASTQSRRQYKDATDLVCSVDCRNFNETGKHGTLQAKGNGGQSLNYMGAVREGYSVRRLTPLECERLQGFPDGWTDIPGQTEASKEELEFWRDVWFTWDKLQAEDPEEVKPRTDKRLLRWLKNPVSDSAQYKALGNSVAIPCPEYVMEGISEILDREQEQ